MNVSIIICQCIMYSIFSYASDFNASEKILLPIVISEFKNKTPYNIVICDKEDKANFLYNSSEQAGNCGNLNEPSNHIYKECFAVPIKSNHISKQKGILNLEYEVCEKDSHVLERGEINIKILFFPSLDKAKVKVTKSSNNNIKSMITEWSLNKQSNFYKLVKDPSKIYISLVAMQKHNIQFGYKLESEL